MGIGGKNLWGVTEMFENVNIRSSVPVYLQIENVVQFAVASGKLKPGDQLPSMLELSEKLGLNPNTVAKSYRDLEVMGVVYTRRGMGVYINKGVEAKCKETCRKRTIARLHEVVSEAKAAGMAAREIKEVCEESFSSTAGPYAPTPDSLLALARPKKR
jgi:GntR family transcriptional regulator